LPLWVLGSFVDYLTVRLPFNVDGDVAKGLLSTAWLFRVAAHRVLAVAKQMQFLPSTNPAKSITLKQNHEFHVTTVRYDGSISRVVIKPTVSRSYRELLNAVLFERVKYMGRVVVRDYGVRGSQLWVHGEVQVTVPMDVYYEHMVRRRRNAGKLIGGVDVNTNRINLAIIDEDGELIDHKTFWFSEVTARGFPMHKAWGIIGMRIHELLD